VSQPSADQWRDPAWLAEAQAWIRGRVEEQGWRVSGEIEQPHIYPWSTAMRVPTDAGVLWFKANTPALRHEAALARLLGKRCTALVPPPVAVDTRRGWLLMHDAGEQLRVVQARERSLDRWLDVLPAYARLQLDLAGDADSLVALGVPRLTLAGLADRYLALVDLVGAEPRFRAAAPRVAELAEELASYGIPDTLQHDDLHDGQVFVRDGRQLVLDWGDACVSHPFFTLSVTLEGVLSWGLDDVEDSVDTTPFRDAYLAPFAERYADVDLVTASRAAMRLGWACRAVNGHVPGEDDPTLARLRMFLDGRA
jgi:hypothetical protein